MSLEYMLRIMRDPREPAARRDEMAKAAAPFLHPRMQATAPSIDDGSPVVPVIGTEKGLFEDTSRIGTRAGWEDALRSKGYYLRGHRLLRAKVRPQPSTMHSG
jgi:hypothetical protein